MDEHLFSKHNESFRSFIDQTMGAESLTIFCGAGCSAEMGVPTWEPMLEQLLSISLRTKSSSEQLEHFGLAHKEAVQLITDANKGNPARLATLCRLLALNEANHHATLRLALYGRLAELKPGPTLRQVAEVYKVRAQKGLKTWLLTTNFDEGLSLALRGGIDGLPGVVIETLGEIGMPDSISDESADAAQRAVEEFDAPTDLPIVRHLHGYLPSSAGQVLGPIVVSESGYAEYGQLSSGDIADRMASSVCVFVGLSLTDIDLISAAFTVDHHPGTSQHFALVCEDRSIPDIVKTLNRSRLARLNIVPLEPIKAFSQVPQLLNELATATEAGAYWDGNARYGLRLAAWGRAFSKAYDESTPSKMHSTQDEVSSALRRELDELRDRLYLGSSAETLALHLWARSSESYTYHLWASTEYAARQWGHKNYESEPSLSGRLVVKQAFLGVPTRGFEPTPSSRWKLGMAVPIVSPPSAPYGRIQVGVLSLATDQPRPVSAIHARTSNNPSLLADLQDNLESLGRRALCAFSLV